MSLGTRLTLKTAVLVLAVLVVAGAALWGLGGLDRDLDAALGQYDRLRVVYTVSNQLGTALGRARSLPAETERVKQGLLRALLGTDKLEGLTDPGRLAAIRAAIREAHRGIDQAGDAGAEPERVRASINTALSHLSSEIDATSGRIEQIAQDAQTQQARVMLWVTLTAGIASLLAIAVGVWQYLAVMNPLRRLQRGVNRLSSGDFTNQLKSTGDREFVALANDFNRMADELATLYRELEEKVRIRSAQLAQSERLASVGFLAAGVAHEINNPLAIIAGEAELALNTLPDDADPALRQALSTTRDEAFRCKAITQKLVSLARPGSGKRERIDLNEVVESVSDLVRTLPQHEARTLSVHDGPGPMRVDTDPAQVKQVLLNLVINAFEAVEPGEGRVRVTVGETERSRYITVDDNGRGISASALPKIFQPFYSEKKAPASPGLGLGLSISHAIITDLGGRLYARSPGDRGQGSSFTIELPIPEGGTTN